MGGRSVMRRGGTGRRGRGGVVAFLAVLALVGSACSKGRGSGSTYEVSVQNFKFSGLPASVKSGNFTVNFSNRESFPITHEMVLIQLSSGKTNQNVIDDAKSGGADSEGEWLHFGEIGEVDTGATKVGLFDLPPGTYALACWQQGTPEGATDGPTHASIGMVFQFTVTS